MTKDKHTRCIMLADYIIENEATVRECARKFGVAKSTVHTDVTKNLLYADTQKAADVRKVLDKNLEERHMRGGLATKAKYERAKA